MLGCSFPCMSLRPLRGNSGALNQQTGVESFQRAANGDLHGVRQDFRHHLGVGHRNDTKLYECTAHICCQRVTASAVRKAKFNGATRTALSRHLPVTDGQTEAPTYSTVDTAADVLADLFCTRHCCNKPTVKSCIIAATTSNRSTEARKRMAFGLRRTRRNTACEHVE